MADEDEKEVEETEASAEEESNDDESQADEEAEVEEPSEEEESAETDEQEHEEEEAESAEEAEEAEETEKAEKNESDEGKKDDGTKADKKETDKKETDKKETDKKETEEKEPTIEELTKDLTEDAKNDLIEANVSDKGSMKGLIIGIVLMIVFFAVVISVFFVKKSMQKKRDYESLIGKISLLDNAFAQLADQMGTELPYIEEDDATSEDGTVTRKIVNPSDNLRIERIKKSDGREITEVVIDHPKQTVDQMVQVDNMFDDGDLTRGRFIQRDKNVYSLKILQKKPELKIEDKKKSEEEKAKEAESCVINREKLDENFVLK